MRIYLSCAAILAGAYAMGQSLGPGFQNWQQTSGVVGSTPGQTARLNVVYPTIPAPFLQTLCSTNLVIADDQARILKSASVNQLVGGRSASLDLNADIDLAGSARTQIHGLTVAPGGCHLVMTLEIIDNITQRTVVVVGGERTYPPTQTTPLFSPLAPPADRPRSENP